MEGEPSKWTLIWHGEKGLHKDYFAKEWMFITNNFPSFFENISIDFSPERAAPLVLTQGVLGRCEEGKKGKSDLSILPRMI